MNLLSHASLSWWRRLGLALFLLPVLAMTGVYGWEVSQGLHAGFGQRHATAITIASRMSIAGIVILSLLRVWRRLPGGDAS